MNKTLVFLLFLWIIVAAGTSFYLIYLSEYSYTVDDKTFVIYQDPLTGQIYDKHPMEFSFGKFFFIILAESIVYWAIAYPLFLKISVKNERQLSF